MHVARREQLRDVGRPAPPADFLVVAERQIDGAPGLRIRGDDVLHRLESPDEAPLVVQRAATPHVAAGDPSLERRLRPAALRSRLHRHDVLMREQDDRWKVRIGPGPLVQQPVAVHLLELECGMDPGERRPQVGLEAGELTGVELGRVLIGDGLEAQRAGQTLCQRGGIERLHRHGRRRRLARAEREGALEHDGGEHEHQDEQRGADGFFHGARRWRDGARRARGPLGPLIDYTPRG